MSAFRSDEGGQSVVLIAVCLPLILSLLLLVIDGGRLYVERERMRNAAQLAAEAAVSLAADRPGASEPNTNEVTRVADEAIRRNLGDRGWGASAEVRPRADVPQFHVQVNITRQFQASIQALRIPIGASAAAMLGASASAPPTPPPATTPPPSATPTPTQRATTTPTPTPSPTPTPRVRVTISSRWYSPAELARYYNNGGCPSARGCYRPYVDHTFPPGYSGASYDTDDRNVGIGLMTPPGETHVYNVTIRYRNGTSERVNVTVTWPADGRPYASSPYAVTVTRP